MAQPDCPDQAALLALSLGELAVEQRALITAHLASCADCQITWRQLQSAASRPDEPSHATPPGSGTEPTRPLPEHLAANRDVGGKPKWGDAPRLSAGMQMGEYEVLGPIDSGGMGQVYRARHRRMDRLVALKVMSPQIQWDETSVRRFQREVQVAARLDHPNIVAAYDAGEADGIHFLVMQLVDGASLSTIVKREGPLALQHAVDCVAQAARGLAYAHSVGVIHRDIKPANLLLDQRQVLKVLDMGLARLNTWAADDALTATEQVMGTVDYMSPEQIAGAKHVDGRADIYSLGCTLWYLLTGKSMYRGTLVQRMAQHRDAPPPPLAENCPDVPAALEAVWQKMVAKDPDDRYADMGEVIAALRPWAPATADDLSDVGHPTAGTERSAPARATRRHPDNSVAGRRWLNRRRGGLLACGLALFVGLIATRGFWLVDGPTGAPAQDPSPPSAETKLAEARRALAAGDAQQAVTLISHVLDQAPTAALYVQRAEARYRLGDLTAALRDCNQALALDEQLAAAYAWRGLASDDADQMIQDCTRALQLDDSLVEAIAGRAYGFGQHADFEAAEAFARQAIQQHPDSPWGYVVLGGCYTDSGRAAEAISHLEKAIAADPTLWVGHAGMAYARFVRNDYQTAVQSADEAIRLAPRSSIAYGYRAMAHAGLNDGERATNDSLEAIRLDTDRYFSHLARGFANLLNGATEKALADADVAVRMAPRSFIPYFFRAVVRLRREEFDLAIRDADQAIEMNPRFGQLYFIRGRARLQMATSRDTPLDAPLTASIAEDLHKADALAPSTALRAEALQLLGRTQVLASNDDEALAALNECLALQPDNLEASFLRACSHMRQGANELAEADFGQCIALLRAGSQHEEIDLSTTLLMRGMVAMQRDRYEQAIADFQAVIELQPTLAMAHQQLGAAYVRNQQSDLALEPLNTALRLEANGDIYYWRGRARINLGQPAPAAEDLDQAWELGTFDEVLGWLIRAHAMDRNNDAALRVANEAVDDEPDEADTYYWRARVRLWRGELDAAMSDVGRAVELGGPADELQRVRQLIQFRRGDRQPDEQEMPDPPAARTGSVRITEVVPASAAERLGLQVGDILLSYDSAPITAVNDLIDLTYTSGDNPRDLVVERQGVPHTFHVPAGTLGIMLSKVPSETADQP